MGAWELKGPVVGAGGSWRARFPELQEKVERIVAPTGRGIAWEGAEIWAYKGRPKNIVEVFRNNVRDLADREAYVFWPEGQRLTWRETGELVNRAAYQLRHEHGFRKGDRLGLLTPGSSEYVIGYLAAITLGAVAVPVNLGLAPESIAAQINKVRAKALVVAPDILEQKVLPILEQLVIRPTIFVTGRRNEADSHGFMLFDDLTGRPVDEVVREEIDEWDLCAISFTSGTTGAPKGTMAMHINALGCAEALVDILKGVDRDDVNVCLPPLYHNTAVYVDFLPALFTGGKCVVLAAFTPLEAIRLIDREKPTWAVAAPIMLWMMMNHPEFQSHDCSSLRKFAFGGHASSETFIKQLQDTFRPIAIVNAGSVSESTALGFALPTEDAIRKITSCGLATPNSEIAIFDDQGNEITEPEVIGEVGYKGQQTNAGYWEDVQRTGEVFRKDGYVLSGDWAKLDDEGYLWLLDRKKDMIVRGGQNVYCIEVENKLYLHDKILRAAVVGVPDHVFSERIKAVIVAKPGMMLTRDEIRDHCQAHLASYERPEYIVFAKTIATNPAGKTMKPPLVDFWGDLDGRENPALAAFTAFCTSMPDNLTKVELLRFEGVSMTPETALNELHRETAIGQRLAQVINESGVVALLKPKEARFRK
ncbi:MAG TPA: class I adenylate-forming enzyme family protein [Bellilinea sp.]|nr:class I adenylate-forming enzyme family protein [Bellilinea sp.]